MNDHTYPDCPRCGGPTAGGLLVDHGPGGTMQVRWVAGSPRGGWVAAFGNELPKDAVPYRVVTVRCERCGHLDSYARDRA